MTEVKMTRVKMTRVNKPGRRPHGFLARAPLA
jgi:hypothetical protein